MTRAPVTAFLIGVALALIPSFVAFQARPAAAIVADIIRADYEADLSRLLRLYEELNVPDDPGRQASRIHYWRGFARWRRAINGVNDGAPLAQMRGDLRIAAREFDASLVLDPRFVDARAGLVSAIGIQLFLAGGDRTIMQPLIDRVMPMLQELTSRPQDNPRVLWVLGQAEWRTPSDWSPDQVLARQERVIASYLRALDLIRTSRNPRADPLDPRWGEPELLMNLAWSSLNKVKPDVAAAERYAREALTLVPSWHYVRDILLPQIERTRR
jgi:hypothetical protein